MERPELPPELQRVCYCPDCARPLVVAPTLDPWILCLACDAGHRYFVEPDVDRRMSATAAAAKFAELDAADLNATALFWLTDARARAILNMQVAQMLRAVLEQRAPERTATATYCPVCATALVEGTVSVSPKTGLVCSAKHEWFLLLRSLSAITGVKEAFVLHPEWSRQGMVNLVHAWLEDEGYPQLRGDLPESVRAVLLNSVFANAPVSRPSP